MEPIIRTARPEDAPELLAIYTPYVINTAITFEYTPPTAEEFANRITHTLQQYPYLVLEADGQIFGYAYAGTFKGRAAYDWACEVSIYISSEARGRGFGRMLYQALENQLRAMCIINLYACIAYPAEDDPYLTRASVDFHTRLGYTLCGTFHQCGYKFDRWYDMVWMEKMLGEHPVPVQPISKPMHMP